MATHTVSSAVPSSHLQTITSPDDAFPSRENARPPQPSYSRSTKPALPRDKATNGPQPSDGTNVGATGTGAIASAGAPYATAIAAGRFAHAKLLPGPKAVHSSSSTAATAFPSDNHIEKQRYQSAHGPGEIAYASVAAAVAGMGSTAIARGNHATAAAAGTFSHAIVRRGGEAEAAGAVGSRCLAESFSGHAFVTATGTLCYSVSHRAACPAVAVGLTPSHTQPTPQG